MSRKKILRYTIWHPDKNFTKANKWGTATYNFVTRFKLRHAQKAARKMGSGAIIQRVAVTNGGKLKIREWIYETDKRDDRVVVE